MGWCSATEIMDAAIQGAITLVEYATDERADTDGNLTEREVAVLSPFVSKIAEKLRDGDWDCIEESDYFHLFPKEMLGLDDHAFGQWKDDQLSDWDGTAGSWPRWAGPVPEVVR